MTSYLEIWSPVSVNRSNRPILEDGEHIVFVKEKVGVYQGQQKIINRQSGRLYLSNRRILYVDDADPMKSMSLSVAAVESCGVIDGFLRSSAKVRVSLRADNCKQPLETSPVSKKATIIDWVCQICSFNNHLDTNTDLDADFPRCVSCGIPPQRASIESLIASSSRAESAMSASSLAPSSNVVTRDDQCPKCTFINHPSLRYCELCGCELKSLVSSTLQKKLHTDASVSTGNLVVENQPHLNIRLENNQETYSRNPPYVKFSFRAGGEQMFLKSLTGVMEVEKWRQLETSGAINKDATKLQPARKASNPIHGGGIHGLEQIGERRRQENETMLSTSLEDLEQLMHRAEDLLKLSVAFLPLIKNKVAYKTIVPPLRIKKTSGLYHRELARHISEYCVNGPLSRKLSMISTQDLFANYNRYIVMTQGFGLELLTPADLQKVLELTREMNLPIQMKRYEKSGLVVICLKEASSFRVKDLLERKETEFEYKKLKFEVMSDMGYGDRDDYMKNMYSHYHGCSATEIADSFNWSYSIAIEELDASVSDGTLAVDNSTLGTFYFVNRFAIPRVAGALSKQEVRHQVEQELADEQRMISRQLHSPPPALAPVTNSSHQDPASVGGNCDRTQLALDDLHGLRF